MTTTTDNLYGKANTLNNLDLLRKTKKGLEILLTVSQHHCLEHYGTKEKLLADIKLPEKMELTLSDELKVLEYAYRAFDEQIDAYIKAGEEALSKLSASSGEPELGPVKSEITIQQSTAAIKVVEHLQFSVLADVSKQNRDVKEFEKSYFDLQKKMMKDELVGIAAASSLVLSCVERSTATEAARQASRTTVAINPNRNSVDLKWN